MKNVLIYTNPNNCFDEETATLVKIQIDNGLDLGWKLEDILLFTNFPYEYMGVKSVIVPCLGEGDKASNKIPVIVYLMEKGMLDDKELYWYHDFDAYQLEKMDESELGLEAYDIGFTTYAYKVHWNLGVIFFKKSAYDIIKLLNDTMPLKFKSGRSDEKALHMLTCNGKVDMSRVKTMNARYNITMRDVGYCYHKAKKPLITVHFHPYYHDHLLPDTLLNTFMYGTHYLLKKPLMTERLIRLFHKYGIK